MPKGTTRLNKALSNISVRYTNEDYIAGRLLKEVPVIQDSGSYFVYGNDFRIPESYRSPRSAANMVEYEMSTSTYNVFRHSLKELISDEERDNTDAPLDLDADTTEYLTDKILMRNEYEAMKVLFTTTTFSNNATLNTASSWVYNTTTSAPIQNVLSATTYIANNAGVTPNTMVFNRTTHDALKENTNVYSRIQYTDRAIMTTELLSAVFDMKQIFVGTAIYNQAKEGATDSMTTIWGTDCLVCYQAPNMGRKTRTAAVSFRVNKYGTPFQVKKWREEELEGDFIEVGSKFGVKAVATLCGYLFKTVTLV